MVSTLEVMFSKVLASPVTRAVRVFGGDVNETYRLDMADGNVYFLKLQRGVKADFYAAETEGLQLLAKVARTPAVVRVGEVDNDAYLVMTHISSGPRHGVRRDGVALGRMLAAVHRQRSPNGKFGSDVPIVFGPCRCPAGWWDDWPTYYVDVRLAAQVSLARKKGLWNAKRDTLFNQFGERFKDFFKDKEVQPSLLHGDLWGGNVMYNLEGEPYLIDPSSYYGHREVDLAMTRLFGGFGADFYEAYEAEMPLDVGHASRVPCYQLLPLLFHLNLFGETYGGSVESSMRNYP